MEFAQALPGLFVGSHPKTIEDIETLRQLGVTAVLNLQTNDDMISVALLWQPLEEHYKTIPLRSLVRMPVKEEQTEMAAKFAQCVSTLSDLISEGHSVYLHCTAGIARSPRWPSATSLEAGWEWNEAVVHLRQLRG